MTDAKSQPRSRSAWPPVRRTRSAANAAANIEDRQPSPSDGCSGQRIACADHSVSPCLRSSGPPCWSRLRFGNHSMPGRPGGPALPAGAASARPVEDEAVERSVGRHPAVAAWSKLPAVASRAVRLTITVIASLAGSNYSGGIERYDQRARIGRGPEVEVTLVRRASVRTSFRTRPSSGRLSSRRQPARCCICPGRAGRSHGGARQCCRGIDNDPSCSVGIRAAGSGRRGWSAVASHWRASGARPRATWPGPRPLFGSYSLS